MSTIVTSSKTGIYNLSPLDSGIYFHNTGATSEVAFFLPSQPYAGLFYAFTVATPQILRVVATGNASITCGQATTAVNGNIATKEFGSSVSMYCKLINTVPFWFVTSLTGMWQIN
jgi:hypothetical protein